ncbi:MAG: hypothetical protein WC889_11635 [Myxococcota bacterium]|jgi:hypothetical protein
MTVRKLIPALAVLAVLAVAFTGCVSRSDMETVRDEIAVAKGDIEKLKLTVASQAQELKIAQGTVDSLKIEVKELREAQKSSPEKQQNKATGAKPKSKTRKRR